MRKGFTLAEMLITVGLIGTLAVILLPVLQDSRPNQEQLMFRKVFSITERIVSELVNDEELYHELQDEDRGHYLANLSNATYHGSTYSGETKFAGLFMAMMNSLGSSSVATGRFTTPDGIEWILPVTDFQGSGARIISVDVNGSKAPNCYYNSANACKNKPDRFKIKVYNDGRVVPGGCMEKEYLQRRSTSRNAPISVIDVNNLDSCKEISDLADY